MSNYAILKNHRYPPKEAILFKLIGPLWPEKLFIYNAYPKIKFETTMIEQSTPINP